jgi:hypothetical protein
VQKAKAVNIAEVTTMIVTQHNDNLRTGLNPEETILTRTNVSNSVGFGKVFERFVDGSVDAQPLIVLNIPFPFQLVDVMIVATMHNFVYALHLAT